MKKYLNRTEVMRFQFWVLLLFASCWLGSSSGLSAQAFDYGNGWYDPGTQYIRFKVTEDGIYRVSAQQLLNAGFDTAGVDPSHLHLLYRGLEEYLYVDTVGNGLWDYVEYFGRRNDGGMDTLMYVNSYAHLADGSLHPNPHISTFSDTSTYYFYADNQPGLRLQTPFLGTVPPPLMIEEIQRTSIIEYHPNNGATFRTDSYSIFDIFASLNPDWTWGEGYVGRAFSNANDLLVDLPTPHYLNNGPAKLHLRIESLISWTQEYAFSLNGQVIAYDTFNNFGVKEYDFVYPFSFVSDTQQLRIHATVLNGNTAPYLFLNVAAISYTAATDLDGGTETAFPISNTANVYYKFRQIATGNMAVAYDLIHHVRHTDSIHGDSLGIWIAGQSNPGYVYLCSDQGIRSPIIEPGLVSNLSATSNAANMVLITSRALSSSAAAYQSYRQSSLVNPLTVKIVYTDEIYEEFGHGSPHPMAIKHFCKYALDQWAVKPDYFMLWGKGKVDIRAGGLNHVPAYGEPVCDNMYVSAFERDSLANPIQLEAAIGRVPVLTDQQGFEYVNKLSIYEGISAAPWMRNGVFVASGHDTTILKPIDQYMNNYTSDFEGSPAYGRSLRYSWLDTAQVNAATISEDSAIDQGASLVCMFGIHPSSMGLGAPSQRLNEGRFPIVISLTNRSCAFGSDTLCTGEQWILEPTHGAIAVSGYGSYLYLTPIGNWAGLFYQSAFGALHGESLGRLLAITHDTLTAIWTDQVYRNHVLTLNLLGDPSIHFRTGSFAVWPGDADDDLVANNQDLLSIGLAFGDTGALRPNASLNWAGQNATPWDSSFTNGSNHAHADCNGDGIVDAADTLAIVQNYGLVHNKAIGLLGGTADDPELAIETVQDSLQDSSHVQLLVRLGSVLHPADSVYGLAWSMLYNPAMVDSASVVVDFDSCWVGEPGQNLLTLVKHLHALGRIDFAFTRTDHAPVSGEGIIARVGIVVIDNISGKKPGDKTYTPLQIVPADARMIDPAGTDLPLQGLGKLLTVIGEVPEPSLPVGLAMAAYPNPVTTTVYVQTRSSGPCTVSVYDLSGRLLVSEQFLALAHKSVDLKNLVPGAYVLKVENAEGSFQEKLLKVD